MAKDNNNTTKKHAYRVGTLARSNEVSPAHLRNEIAAGRLRAVRIGARQFRIFAKDWELYVAEFWKPEQLKTT